MYSSRDTRLPASLLKCHLFKGIKIQQDAEYLKRHLACNKTVAVSLHAAVVF